MKTKAFTILELLVAMAISTIVFLAGFHGYGLISKQWNMIVSTHEEAIKTESFLFLLRRNIDQAKYVHQQDQALELIYSNKKINYFFLPDLITREQHPENLRDTFLIKGRINQEGFFSSDESDKAIENLNLSIIGPTGNQDFIFTKNYSAEDRLHYHSFIQNQLPNHEH